MSKPCTNTTTGPGPPVSSYSIVPAETSTCAMTRGPSGSPQAHQSQRNNPAHQAPPKVPPAREHSIADGGVAVDDNSHRNDPLAGGLGNAIFNAVGARVRSLPIT